MLVLAAVFFYAPIYKDNAFIRVFAALMVTGTFMYNFGSFVPAWDSQYFKLLMSQGIRYRDYIEAKWWLLVLSVAVFTVLALPYWWYDPGIYKMIAVFAVFNAGLNVFIILATGMLNATPVKLNEKVKAFRSTQSFNGKIMLANFLRLLLPLGLFFLLKYLAGLTVAYAVFVLLGVMGWLLRHRFLDALARAYGRKKYDWIRSFSQDQ